MPVTEWPSLPTPPTPFRSRSRTTEKNEQTEGSERRESNSFPTDRSSNRDGSSNFQTQNRHVQTERLNGFRSSYAPSSKQPLDLAKASSTTKEKTWKGSGEGLGAAAIAGIVIGSLVSITLLAGNSLTHVCHHVVCCKKCRFSCRRFRLPAPLPPHFSCLFQSPISHFLSPSSLSQRHCIVCHVQKSFWQADRSDKRQTTPSSSSKRQPIVHGQHEQRWQ